MSVVIPGPTEKNICELICTPPFSVSHLKMNIPKYDIEQNVGVSPSTGSNNLRGSGQISVCKGQGWRLLLNACDLRALRRRCITSWQRDEYSNMDSKALWKTIT